MRISLEEVKTCGPLYRGAITAYAMGTLREDDKPLWEQTIAYLLKRMTDEQHEKLIKALEHMGVRQEQ